MPEGASIENLSCRDFEKGSDSDSANKNVPDLVKVLGRLSE